MHTTSTQGHGLPCLDSIKELLKPDQDTGFLSHLIQSNTTRATMTIEFAKSLTEKIEKDQVLFKSSKEIEWVIEILGYGFVPPHHQYLKEDKNYLKNILSIYEYILCDDVGLQMEQKFVKFVNKKSPLKISDYNHQKIMCKMLAQMTLAFDRKNFEKRPNIPDPKLREEELKLPMKICAMVLRIYDKFFSRVFSYLFLDTWEYIIKILIGLSGYMLEGSNEMRYSERIEVSLIELLFNCLIYSGLQGDEIWNLFNSHVHNLINKDAVLSYWGDILVELTSKMLIDLGCFPTPRILVKSDKSDEKEFAYEENVLIVTHNYNEDSKKGEQGINATLYLWGRMIEIIQQSNSIVEPEIHTLMMKKIRNVVQLLLKIGTHYKSKEDIADHSQISITNKNTIIIQHEQYHLKHFITKVLEKNEKIKPNYKRPTNQSIRTKDSFDENRKDSTSQIQEMPLSRRTSTVGPENYITSPKNSKKRVEFTSNKSFLSDIEYPWKVMTDQIPSGEYLLKLFGKVLFDMAENKNPKNAEARLDAMTILCQIFIKASGPFSETLLKKFYQVYLDFLESTEFKDHLTVLFKFSQGIFNTPNLQQNIILQKPLVQKMREYFDNTKQQFEHSSDKMMRRACNKICSSLLCFYNDEYGLINEMYRYGMSIKDILSEILEQSQKRDLNAIKAAKAASTAKFKDELKILINSTWNSMVFCIINQKVHKFTEKIEETWFMKGFGQMNKVAIDIYLVLGEQLLQRLDEPQVSESQYSKSCLDIFDSGIIVIDNINKFIESRVKELIAYQKGNHQLKSSEREEYINLVVTSFGVLQTWILIMTHVKQQVSVTKKKNLANHLTQMLNIFMEALTYDNLNLPVKCIMTQLFNWTGGLNVQKNIPLSSSVILQSGENKLSQEEISKRLEEKCLARYGLGEETIISFYDLEISSPNEVITFLVQNRAGSYWWHGELFYKLMQPDQNNQNVASIDLGFDDDITIPIPQQEQQSTQEYKESLSDANEESTADESDINIENLMQMQFEMDEEYAKEFQNIEKSPEKIRKYSKPYTDEFSSPNKNGFKDQFAKKNAIKMFLSNSGLLNIKDISHLTHIPNDTFAIELLNQIQEIPSKCQIKANLIYVQKPSSEKLDTFPKNDLYFSQFLENLGMVIDEEMLQTGAYQQIKKDVIKNKKVLYASNALYEFMFTLPNLTRLNENIEELSKETHITIIWNSLSTDSYEQSFPHIINQLNLKDYKSCIIITPTNKNFYLINVLKKNPEFMLFPPVNDFVSSMHLLPSIILQTVICLDREYKMNFRKMNYNEIMFGGQIDKGRRIGDLIRSKQGKEHFSKLLSSFFDISSNNQNIAEKINKKQ